MGKVMPASHINDHIERVIKEFGSLVVMTRAFITRHVPPSEIKPRIKITKAIKIDPMVLEVSIH